MMPVVFCDKGRRVWMSRKITVERFFVEVLDNQDFDATTKINGFSAQYPPSVFLDWVHDGGFWTWGGWGIQVWKGSEIKESSTSWKVRTVKALMQGRQIDNSPIENLSTSEKFSMPTLIEEIKHVVLMKNEVEFREKSKISCSFWKLRTVMILMQERKQWFCSWMFVYKCCVFGWNFDGGNWTGDGSELNFWLSRQIRMNGTFWDICFVTNPMHGSKQKVCWMNRPLKTKSVLWRLWSVESKL